jgi:U6 snRNA-associated Sm-like protein LSm4
MNVTLRDVYQTSPDGERFWKVKEIFIKGNVVSIASNFLTCSGISEEPSSSP